MSARNRMITTLMTTMMRIIGSPQEHQKTEKMFLEKYQVHQTGLLNN